MLISDPPTHTAKAGDFVGWADTWSDEDGCEMLGIVIGAHDGCEQLFDVLNVNGEFVAAHISEMVVMFESWRFS